MNFCFFHFVTPVVRPVLGCRCVRGGPLMPMADARAASAAITHCNAEMGRPTRFGKSRRSPPQPGNGRRLRHCLFGFCWYRCIDESGKGSRAELLLRSTQLPREVTLENAQLNTQETPFPIVPSAKACATFLGILQPVKELCDHGLDVRKRASARLLLLGDAPHHCHDFETFEICRCL